MDLLFLLTSALLWHDLNANILPTEVYKVISKKHKEYKEDCADVLFTRPSGIITSPNYPESYPNHVSCSWYIRGSVGNTITVSFDDLEIEESGSCLERPCCTYNWIKIGPTLNVTEKQICGHQIPSKVFVSDSQKVYIKFHISSFVKGGRGFRLYYTINAKEDYECRSTDTRCANNECIPGNVRCNGIQECRDGSDELLCSDACPKGQRSCRTVLLCYDPEKHCNGIVDCPDFSDEVDCDFCTPNLTRCGHDSKNCYHPITQRCNRVLDCPNGEDEKDCLSCPGKIMCASGEGCYALKDRCNGIAQCGDGSDEKRCGSDLCNYSRGGFLCGNGHCIREAWRCDRTNDCGDGSDESNCLRNSILTAAIMGSLICGLLLVVAVSCTCRLHALRTFENNILQRETPLSRISREYFFREPPPSYAVATGQHQQNLCVENLHYPVSAIAPLRRGGPRRSQRSNRHRRERRSSPAVLDSMVSSHGCILVGPDGSVTVRPPEVAVPPPYSQATAPTGSRATVSSRLFDRKDEPACGQPIGSQRELKDKSSSSEDESQDSRGDSEGVCDVIGDHMVMSDDLDPPPPYSCDSDSQPLLT